MTFRQTGLCRLIVLALALGMLAGAFPATLGEAEMTEAEIDEASQAAYEAAMLQAETEVAFTTVATLGQYLSDLMVCAYGEIPVTETDSANAAAQLVDEVIRRADLCFHSWEEGTPKERLEAFDRAKEAWKAAAGQFGPAGERFEAGLPLVDARVIDPATDAFNLIPAEAQPIYLETAESVYRALWQALRPAIAGRIGQALTLPGLGDLADVDGISAFEETAGDILAGVKDVLSTLSGGLAGEKSEARARVEQASARLNALEAEVRVIVNVLDVDSTNTLMEE